MDNKELCYMLDLDPDTVEDVNITRKDEKYVFSIVMKRQTYECPECHSSHVNIKANKSKKLVGAQFNNCPSIYMIHFKRLCCRDCGSSFYDHVPLADETTKIARVTQLHILEDLKPFNSVFASVARKYDISTTKVISLFDENVQVKRHPLPRILLIDEFYFQRHSQQKYAFVMMNFENKVIVDIIKSRWQNVLSDYFYSIDAEKGKGEKREKEKVEFVCSDLYSKTLPILSIIFMLLSSSMISLIIPGKGKCVNIHMPGSPRNTDSSNSDINFSCSTVLPLTLRHIDLIQYLAATVSIKPFWMRFFPSAMI